MEGAAPQLRLLPPLRYPGVRHPETRGGLIQPDHGLQLIDDSYNSNPKALEAALKGLASLPAKRRVAVLGDMLELGPAEADFHRQAGRQGTADGWGLVPG